MPLPKLDRERTLKFNIAAARRFKSAYGSPLYLMRMVREGGEIGLLDHDCLCHVLWSGLVHEDRRLTVDKVAELLDVYLEAKQPLKEIYVAIGEAFEASGLFGTVEEDGGKAPTTTTTG